MKDGRYSLLHSKHTVISRYAANARTPTKPRLTSVCKCIAAHTHTHTTNMHALSVMHMAAMYTDET